MDYEEIEAEIKKLPITMLLGIFVTTLRECLLRGNIFKDNDPLPLVKKVVESM